MRYLLIWALLLCPVFACAQDTNLADSLDHLIETLPTADEKVKAINGVLNSRDLVYKLDAEKGAKYALLVLDIATRGKDKYTSLNYLVGHAAGKGDMAEAMRWAKEGLAMAQADTAAEGTLEIVGLFHGAIARVLNDNGQEIKALEHYVAARKIYEELGSVRNTAAVVSNIAVIYQSQGRLQEALVLKRQSLKIAEEQGDLQGILTEKMSIGNMLRDLGKLDSALLVAKEVLPIIKRESLQWLLPVAWIDIARIYQEREEYASSMVYADSALATMLLLDRPPQLCWVRQSRGAILYSADRYPEALAELEKALALAEDMELDRQLSPIYFNLTKVHQKLRNFEKALDFKILEQTINDSLEVIERAEKFADIEAGYEIEKHEAANQILEQKNQIQTLIIAENNAQMAQSRTIWISVVVGLLLLALAGFLMQNQARVKRESQLAQKLARVELKALRAQMNPHFTFNTMNSIQHYIEGRDTEAAKRYLSKFGKLIRQTLENSGSQWVTIEEELEQLQLYMELEALRFAEPFDFTIVLDESLDASFDRIPPMLLQPFLENAVWHGIAHKAGKGAIELSIKVQNDLLRCVIKDNGVGRKQSAALKSKNTSAHKSMGISITRERLEMLTGSVTTVGFSDVEDEAGNVAGTKVELSIPMN